MDNIFIIIFGGVVISELGGFLMIKLSRKDSNFTAFKKIGTFVCILGVGALILGIIGAWAIYN